ncbi:venom metalloproteinase antarease-like TtrivMP_A [Ixodes scapularis]
MRTVFVLLVFTTIGHVLHCKQLHHPEPSLVYPAFLQGRGLSESRILKINEDITLNLRKSSGLAEEFLVRSYVNGIRKHTYLDGSYLEEDLFHDEDAMASVTISDEEGLQVEGMIGNKLRIMPALEEERSSDGRLAHWLHEIPDSYEGLRNDYVMSERRHQNITERAKKKDFTKADIIHPELFLLVDTVIAKAFESRKKLIKYVCRTFNAVNLRYLSVNNPKVQFQLMGIEILSKSRESFLEFVPRPPNCIEGLKSVYNMMEFFHTYPEDYETYDLIYLMTGRDMVAVQGPYIDHGNRGYAFIAAVCGERRVGLGEDKANTYAGVSVMSHELGHLMGCPHDGDRAPHQLGGPGSTSCPFNDGYVMSYAAINTNQYKFSSCCNYMMSLMSWSPLGACLHKKNAKFKLKKRENNLPGKGIKKTTQCKLAFPDMPETYWMQNKKIVHCEMQCFVPKRVAGYDTHVGLALMDGTICNRKRYVCINGRCRKKRKTYLS